MSWQGRQLASASKDGKSLSFTYDSEGIRTSKTVDGVKTEYLLNGTQILAQKTGSTTLSFFYDQQGNRVAMADGSNKFYYYIYNLQGDVIALADGQTGKLAATYTYDAWGKIVKINDLDPNAVAETSIAKINPFRYRGYYYDSESQLYYLQSRYYDAETGRLINADVFTTTDVNGVLSTNMFAYCENNPVMRSDPTGEIWAAVVKMAVGAAVSVMTTVVSNAITGSPLADGIGEAALEGALTGVAGTALGTTISVGFSIYNGLKNDKSEKEIAVDAAITAVSLLAGSGVSRAYGKQKFSNFAKTASNKHKKIWGNLLAEKPMGNKYKNIDNWTKDMKNATINYYSGSAYGTYLSHLVGSGTLIVSTTLHTRPR